MRTVVAIFATALLATGCATVVGTDGQVQTVAVSCEATTPAKSVACASATLSSLANTTTAQVKLGKLTQEQAASVQGKLEKAYGYVLRAEQAASLDLDTGDYLSAADILLALIEQELK